jgi:gliding motility-associated lipoprotein GldH
MQHYKNFLLFSLIFLAGLLAACERKPCCQKSNPIPKELWNKDSTFVYECNVADSSKYYNFYINIRNTTDYAYQNLWLFFTSQLPDSTVFTDTLNCILFDAYGRWTGKGSGRIKENQLTFKSKVRFPQTGDYTFTIQQAMRDDNLTGITDIGITLQHE